MAKFHIEWLWLWFLIGMATYWLKRAYYLVTGPNPVANNYTEFIKRCWIPLLVRAFLDSLVFWAMFTPGFISKALGFFGWQNAAAEVEMIIQFAPFSAVFGHTVDSVVDIAVSKIPLLNGILPQMPGPLQPPAPVPVSPVPGVH